jgi:cytochrome c peroxidase
MSLKEAVDYHITNKYHLKMSKEKLLTRVKSNEGLYKRIKKVYGRVSYENVVDALENFLKALTFEAKIDKFLSGNNEALSKQEYEGYILFKNLGCRDCHSGRNFGGEIKANTHGNKRGYWRVPSLRFVVCTAPYLHNGSKDTLDEALEYTIETFIGIKLGKEKINKLKLFLKTLGNK